MSAHCAKIPRNDRCIYLVLVDYGPRLGKCWAERPIERTGYAKTLEDIMGGHLAPVVQVLEIEPTPQGLGGFFSTRDVTEDFQCNAIRPEVRSQVFCEFTAADHARDLRKHEVV